MVEGEQDAVVVGRVGFGRPLPAARRPFFFSSRRRHTRGGRDWSSDVCSSDLADLQKLLNAQYFGSASDFELQDVSIDSRSLKNTEGVLFFAIQGTFHDAHQFIPELIDRGVRQFVVQYIPEKVKEQAQFFVVENVLQSFQQFAAYYRSLFTFPV